MNNVFLKFSRIVFLLSISFFSNIVFAQSSETFDTNKCIDQLRYSEPELTIRHKLYYVRADFRSFNPGIGYSPSALISTEAVEDPARYAFSNIYQVAKINYNNSLKSYGIVPSINEVKKDIFDTFGIKNLKIILDDRKTSFMKGSNYGVLGSFKFPTPQGSIPIDLYNCKSRHLNYLVDALDVTGVSDIGSPGKIVIKQRCILEDKAIIGSEDPFTIDTIVTYNKNVCLKYDTIGNGTNPPIGVSSSSFSRPDSSSSSSFASDCVDSDGDGWGWDGTKSCRVSGTDSTSQSGDAPCIDSDGDGWGWDGEKSCRP